MANVKEEAKSETKIAEAVEEVVKQSTKAMEATEAIAAMDGTDESAAEEAKIVIPKIYVVRRKYTNKSDGKQYWEYILPAVFRGSVSCFSWRISSILGIRSSR